MVRIFYKKVFQNNSVCELTRLIWHVFYSFFLLSQVCLTLSRFHVILT